MPDHNKRTAIDPPDTNASKRSRTADLPPPDSSQLAQIHAAVTAATTLLATLASLATTLALAERPATPITHAIEARLALPAASATTQEPKVGVLASLSSTNYGSG